MCMKGRSGTGTGRGCLLGYLAEDMARVASGVVYVDLYCFVSPTTPVNYLVSCTERRLGLRVVDCWRSF